MAVDKQKIMAALASQNPVDALRTAGSTPEQLRECFTPEQLREWFTPAQLRACFTPEQLREWFTPAQLRACFTPEQLREWFTPEQLREWFTPEQLRAWFTMAQLRACFTLAELRACFTLAELRACFTLAELRACFTLAELRACFTAAELREIEEEWESIPIIPNLYTRLLAAISAGERIHNQTMFGPDECPAAENLCRTPMCTAGHLVNLAGEAGYTLQRKYGFPNAARMIHMKNRPDVAPQNFGSIPQELALAYIRQRAHEEQESA